MNPAIGLFEQDQTMRRRLQRRDRRVLQLYALSGVAMVLGGEAAAFYLGMADRYGFTPVLLRGIVYLLLTLALLAALLRSNRRMVIRLMQERRQDYESILLAYDSALSLKDAYTGGHGRRVARYARLIAGALGRSEAERDSICEAALLHDLGKIGMPDRILAKPDRLTEEEFSVAQRHSAAGADILHAIPPLRRLAKAVRHHHERFDGNGYPDRLRGTDIPLASRIIAVADAFDALTTDRSYRRGVAADQALNIIAQAACSRYDPEIVTAIRRPPARDALLAAHGDMA